jgi:hypothetical protein
VLSNKYDVLLWIVSCCMSHVIAGHGEHRAWWRCGRLFWGWRWINGTRARGSSYVLSTRWGDRKVRYYEYSVLHGGIIMCEVSYNVTGEIPATLPSFIFCMCITDTFQTGDWVFFVKNSLFCIKCMVVTKFCGQKLSRSHKIYCCNWVSWSKTLLFTWNLWLTEFLGQKLSHLHQTYGCNWQLQIHQRTPVWLVYHTFHVTVGTVLLGFILNMCNFFFYIVITL